MDFPGASSGSNWQSGADALRQGRVQEAITQLSAFVQAHPGSFEGNNFLGVALAQAGRHQEAIGHLQQAVRLNPQSAQAHYNLGLACAGVGQNDTARTEFQTTLQLDPNHSRAQQALARLAASTPPSPTETAFPVAEPMASTAPTESSLSTASPWGDVSATGEVPAPATAPATVAVAPPAKLTALDFLKAFVFGVIAAVVGAFIWDKITYYTNYQIGLVAAGVGFLVGLAVSMGAGGKSGTSLQVMGAVLAGLGILLGQGLIVMDYMRDMLAKSGMSPNPLLLLLFSISQVPAVLKEDPLTLIFVAFGIYEGWKIPGGSKPQQPAEEQGQKPDQAAGEAAGETAGGEANTGQEANKGV